MGLFDRHKPYIDLSTLAKKAKGYSCPKCGAEHDGSEDGYDLEGKHYPQYFNESIGSTMDGNYNNWDELHKCHECGTEFWFSNGAY